MHQPLQHRIFSGEIEIAATEYPGNGPLVLLIHGIGSSGAGWDNIIPALSVSTTPVTIDQRGHGASGHPDSGYLYDDYIGDLDAVLAHFDIEHPLIVGHSLGGIVALWWAARYPDRAAALVIEDSPLRSGESFRPAFEGWLAFNALTEVDAAARYRQENPDWPDELVALRARQITSTARGVFSELFADSIAHQGVDRIAEIEGVQSPVLLIHGDIETGGMVVADDATALKTRLPNVALAHIPGASHRIHAERLEEFVTLTVDFLKRHTS
ncbi:MAG: alpha/beta hydrolase [Thermomicrobiales bacterium]